MKKAVKWCDLLIYAGLLIFVLSLPLSLSGAELGFYLALLFWIIKMFITKDFKIPSTSLDLPIAIFWLITILSIIFSMNPIVSLNRLRKIPLFFMPYLMANNIKDEKKLYWLIQTLLFSTTITAILGILSYYNGADRALVNIGKHSTFTPNSLAIFLLLNLSFSVIFFINRKSVMLKITNGLLSLIIFMSIILTYGRATYLGLLVTIFLGLFSKRARYISLIILCLLIVFLFVFPRGYNRLKTVVNKGETGGDRIYMWQSGIKIFKDHYLKGLGIDCVIFVYDKYREPLAIEEASGNLHNNFIQETVEKGIGGLIAFLWLFGSFFEICIETYRNTIGVQKEIVLGCILAFIGFMVVGFFESNLFVPLILRLWLFIAGVCLTVNTFTKLENKVS